MTQTINTIKTFGERISTIMAREGLEQQQFGDDIDATKSQVSRWVNDKSLPKSDAYYHRIAEKYDYNYQWVKYGIGPEKKGEADSTILADAGDDDKPTDPAKYISDRLDEIEQSSIPSALKKKFYQKLLRLAEQVYNDLDNQDSDSESDS